MDPVPLAGWAQADEIALIRRASTSLYARLRSIEHDARRALHLHAAVAPHLPLFGNLRAGAWYTPGAGACAFKSADGHYGQWRVSTRRPNAPFLRALAVARGAVVVDVTRAGKVWPDALSKSLPMWCAVVSALAQAMRPDDPRLSTLLHLHPTVPPSEVAAIQRLLPEMVRTWEEAGVDVRALAPELLRDGDDDGGGGVAVVRCLWTRADTDAVWEDGLPSAARLGYVPVLCISASPPLPAGARSFVEADAADDPNDPALGLVGVFGVEFAPRNTGFAYVQGAGDDEEGWSCGLTSKIFWENRCAILAYCEERQNVRQHDAEFRDGLAEILRCGNKNMNEMTRDTDGRIAVSAAESPCLEVSGVLRCAQLRILASKPSSLREDVATAADVAPSSALVLVLSHSVASVETSRDSGKGVGRWAPVSRKNIIWFSMRDTRGKPDYKHALLKCIAECLRLLCETILEPEREQYAARQGVYATVVCDSGDGDWATAVAVAWMAMFAESDLSGLCDYSNGAPRVARSVGKQRLKQIALRIATERADLVLSRRSSQQLNMFFMSALTAGKMIH